MPEVAEELLERVGYWAGWFNGSFEGVECCSDDGGVAVTDSIGGFGSVNKGWESS